MTTLPPPPDPAGLRAIAKGTKDKKLREALFARADVQEGLSDPDRVRAPEPPVIDVDPETEKEMERRVERAGGVEPWAAAVVSSNGQASGYGLLLPSRPLAELLELVENTLRRFVVFANPHQAVAVTLWVAHTYVFARFDSTPYLHVSSATKQAGKTRLFEVLELLVARAWRVIEVSEAVLFRNIEAKRPTLLLDEVDASFGKDSTMTEGIRGVLNAGYRTGAVVPRCVPPSFEAKDFNVYCPKAFAGIGGKLPSTVIDRSIPVELRRRSPTEPKPERFRLSKARIELPPIAAELAAWAKDAELGEPDELHELSDRQMDVWEPLFAVADLADGDWPERARRAAVVLHSGADKSEDDSIRLLSDISEAFDELDRDKLSTESLLDHLVNRGDDSPWARWWGEDVGHNRLKGPASQLARKLKPFEITPGPVWVDGAKTRGYERADFLDAWARYTVLAPYPPGKDGRTVGRRSEANSDSGPAVHKTGPDQDPTVLPFHMGEEGGRALERNPPEPLAAYAAHPTNADLERWASEAGGET